MPRQATHVWRSLALVLCFTFGNPLLTTAQSFTVTVNISDGAIEQSLVIGMHPSATDQYDPGLDQGAPPFPFPGIFQAQVINTDVILSQGFYQEFRAVDMGPADYLIRYQRGGGQQDIMVSWEPSTLPDGRTLTIVDTSLPPIFGQDMKTSGALIINSSSNNELMNELLIRVGEATDLPVELISFSAALEESTVALAWETLSETNNAGFYVERSLDGRVFESLTFVDGQGTTQAPQTYQYADRTLPRDVPFLYYRLKQIDFDGTFAYAPVITVDASRTHGFRLEPAFPNPTTDRAFIGYALENREQVSLTIYDALGRKVHTLVEGTQKAGWYRVSVDTAPLPDGLYFYHLKTPTFAQTRSLMVAR